MSVELLVPAAFLAGFFGSTHCIGMCGAIVILFESSPERSSKLAGWSRRVLYNLGRLGFYLLLGAAAGAGGALLTEALGIRLGLFLLRMLAGVLVIAIGLNLLIDWRFTDALERAGARLWQKLSPLARHVVPLSSPPRAFAAGFLWGALPCGLVYSAVAVAATSGTVAQGMSIMLAFWLGTAPALLLAGVSARRLAEWKSRRRLRRLAGAIIVVIGILALMPLAMFAPGRGHQDMHGKAEACVATRPMDHQEGAAAAGSPPVSIGPRRRDGHRGRACIRPDSAAPVQNWYPIEIV